MSEQAAIYAVEKLEVELLPCPHCGSTDLLRNEWSLEGGEVAAVECNGCKSGATLEAWNKRTGNDQYLRVRVEQLRAELAEALEVKANA